MLPLVVEGELPSSWRAQLARRLREGLERGGRPIVDAKATAPCTDAECIRALGRDTGARWIVRARVTVRDRDFDVALELLDANSGTSLTNSSARCEVCAVAEVGDMLADRAAVLDRNLDALLRAPPVIRFESVPPRALVWLDGELVGTAPVERTVEEGRHRARGELDGYLPLELQFDALAGTGDTVTLELSPKPRRAGRRAGWALLGIGLGGLAIGTPLVALHGHPYRARCSGNDVDTDGNCRFVYGTRTGGAVVLAIGAAALVTAVVLLATSRKRGAARRR